MILIHFCFIGSRIIEYHKSITKIMTKPAQECACRTTLLKFQSCY